MKAVKTIAALIFLTALGIVLIQPVLGADDEPGRVKVERVGVHFGEDESETDPDESEPDDDPGDAPADLTTAFYPRRCLRGAEPAAGPGLVAARRGTNVSIGLPDRAPLARTGVEGDAAWSASGLYLAERGGRAFDPAGTPAGALFFQPVEWQWSPAGDCALALTESGNLTASIAGTEKLGIQVVDAPVTDFALSPNGTRIAFVVRDDGLWIADLGTPAVRRVTRSRAVIFGWYSNRSVLYSKSEGSGKLRYASGRGKPRIVKGAFASTTIVRCPGRTLLAAQASESDAPLAELVSRRGRIRHEVLPGTPPTYAGFSDASCSPDGGFLVASALTQSGERGPLVLLGADGTFVRELFGGRTANPEWTSEGVLFVEFDPGGRGRLWFIPPDGAPAPTAYEVGAPNQYDWSAR